MDRKYRAINWAALITALGTAFGSAGYGHLTAGDRDDIKTKMSAELAGYHVEGSVDLGVGDETKDEKNQPDCRRPLHHF